MKYTRKQHVGKSRIDKEDYARLLGRNNDTLDPTEKEEGRLDKTTSSEQQHYIEEKPNITPKSFNNKIKDNGYVIAIVSALILALIYGCFYFTVQQRLNNKDIKTNTEDIKTINNEIIGDNGLNAKFIKLNLQINDKNGILDQLVEIKLKAEKFIPNSIITNNASSSNK